PLNERCFFLPKYKTITEILTKVNAINAPKLIKDATKVKLKNNADNDRKPISKILFTGAFVFLLNFPKNVLGSCPSLPIAYNTREALACAAEAEPKTTNAVTAKKPASNALPPTSAIIS